MTQWPVQSTAFRRRIGPQGRRRFAPAPRIRRLQAGIMLFLVVLVAGCAEMVFLPKAQEQEAIRAGNQAIVLIRVEFDLEIVQAGWFAWSERGKEIIERGVFGLGTVEAELSLGLGSFETAGVPARNGGRPLSGPSYFDGWRYFILAPGTYYLSIQSPRFQGDVTGREQRWRMDLLPGIRSGYAGTIRLGGAGEKYPTGSLLATSLNAGDAAIVDQHELAARLIAAYFPDAAPVRTIPLQRWRPGEPIILRAPLSGPAP
jgi:hypothetical protein